MKAQNTVEAYESDWRQFHAWSGGSAPTVDTLTAWAWHRVQCGHAYASIARGLVGVCSFRPDLQVGAFASTLQDIRRVIGTRQKRARPLFAEDIAKICRRLGTSSVDVRTRALFLVMWCGALRVSEAEAMEWEHMTWHANGIELLIPRSKTDQYGEGAIVVLPEHTQEAVDVVRAVKQWREIAADTPRVWQSLRSRDGVPSGKPIASLERVVHYLLRQHGYGAGYSSHSFRAGWISEAARAGVTETAMQRQTRHSSTLILQAYIREARRWEDSPAGQVTRRLG